MEDSEWRPVYDLSPHEGARVEAQWFDGSIAEITYERCGTWRFDNGVVASVIPSYWRATDGYHAT